MKALAAALLPQGSPVTLAPCRVVTTSPLVIDFYGTEQYPATKIAGLTYTVGAAVALMCSPSKPIVLPLGA